MTGVYVGKCYDGCSYRIMLYDGFSCRIMLFDGISCEKNVV
jgi:hypothetical protein